MTTDTTRLHFLIAAGVRPDFQEAIEDAMDILDIADLQDLNDPISELAIRGDMIRCLDLAIMNTSYDSAKGTIQ